MNLPEIIFTIIVIAILLVITFNLLQIILEQTNDR